jgi:hypothetical protein
MKFIFSNYNQNYIVKFHEVHLYHKNNNKLQYLFIHPIFKYKKYIIDINFYEFKNFIIKCSENESTIKLASDVKIEYKKLTEKLISCKDIESRLYLCQKLGELIFSNYHHKDVFDIKNIYILFTSLNNEDTFINLFNCQIRYLIIMINNLLDIQQNTIRNYEFDMLDFIYDYYLN